MSSVPAPSSNAPEPAPVSAEDAEIKAFVKEFMPQKYEVRPEGITFWDTDDIVPPDYPDNTPAAFIHPLFPFSFSKTALHRTRISNMPRMTTRWGAAVVKQDDQWFLFVARREVDSWDTPLWGSHHSMSVAMYTFSKEGPLDWRAPHAAALLLHLCRCVMPSEPSDLSGRIWLLLRPPVHLKGLVEQESDSGAMACHFLRRFAILPDAF